MLSSPSAAVHWSLWTDLIGSEQKLPKSLCCHWGVLLPCSLSNCIALFCSNRTAQGERIQNLIGIFLLLLSLSSQFCKQVMDLVAKTPIEMLFIYSKMLGIKGEIQTSQKFTLILCWLFLCAWLWTLWQPGLATLPVNPAFCDLDRVQGGTWLSGKLWMRQTPSTELTGMRQTSKKMSSSATTPTKQWSLRLTKSSLTS